MLKQTLKKRALFLPPKGLLQHPKKREKKFFNHINLRFTRTHGHTKREKEKEWMHREDTRSVHAERDETIYKISFLSILVLLL